MAAELLAGALLVWAGVRVLAGYPPAAPTIRHLWRGEVAFLHAASDAVYPAGGAVAPSGSDAGLVGWTDRYVGAVPGRTRLLMRLLFFLLEHATVIFAAPSPWGRRRFSKLSPEQQQAVLEAWRTSSFFPRRLVFTSLRAILSMGYFADPAVQRRLDVAPRAIDSPLCEADWLFPAIGAPRSTIPPRPDGWCPAPPEPPLNADSPILGASTPETS